MPVTEAEKLFSSCATPEFNNSLLSLIKSRQPLIFVSTNEEKRFLAHIENLCSARKYVGYVWDCFRGLHHLNGRRPVDTGGNKIDFSNPETTLNYIINQIETFQVNKRKLKSQQPTNNGNIYVLLDFYRYMKPPAPAIQRRLKYIASESKAASVILTGPSYTSTPSLDKEMSALDFPYPNEYEVNEILDEAVALIGDNKKAFPHCPDVQKYVEENRESLVNSVKGLTLMEAQAAFFKSMVMANQLGHNPFDLGILMKEKRSIIRKTDILEYIEPNVSLADVGGLGNMTEWLHDRKMAFSHEAQQYGLKMPKGVMLLGVPGGGKSLTAKAVAKDYGMPLLRLDFGRMFDSLVGESEKTARAAIKLAETIAPCVSGNSIIYDIDGNPYRIDNLLDDKGKFISEELYVYAFNEEKKKLESTRVLAVIKHAKKKQMIRIKTATTFIEVTRDHKVMVNRDGELQWVEAKNIEKNDLVMTPKYFMRRNLNIDWKDAITIPYDRFDSQKNDKSPKVVAKFDGSYHEVNFVSGFNLFLIYYLIGCIYASGNIDVKTGTISLSANTFDRAYHFSNSMSSMFMVEPSIKKVDNGYKITACNKIIADILTHAGNMIFYQDDIYLRSFLSGMFDMAGEVIDNDEKSKIIFNLSSSDPTSSLLFRKVLHVFGILSYKESRQGSKFAIENAIDIDAIAASLDLRIDNLDTDLSHIASNEFGKDNRNIGYRLGSSLMKERISRGLTKSDFPLAPQSMAHYEKGSIVPQDKAWMIAEVIDGKTGHTDTRITKNSIVDLICSDLIGMKVTKIEEIGLRWAYDLSCEGNHNFVANEILCHNCVLWCDEIEKGLSGGIGAGSGDSGTTKRVISTFLTWLQEKTKPVFVVATANNVLDIPPEFMRAGRFDEVFWIDLPGHEGRIEIFKILLGKKSLNPSKFDLELLATSTNGYTGAEIEKAIDSGMFVAFKNNKRKLRTQDIFDAIGKMKPLSETRKAELENMREWAMQHCVFANTDIDGKPDVPPIGSNPDTSSKADHIDIN